VHHEQAEQQLHLHRLTLCVDRSEGTDQLLDSLQPHKVLDEVLAEDGDLLEQGDRPLLGASDFAGREDAFDEEADVVGVGAVEDLDDLLEDL
jgi:hypothetical protein